MSAGGVTMMSIDSWRVLLGPSSNGKAAFSVRLQDSNPNWFHEIQCFPVLAMELVACHLPYQSIRLVDRRHRFTRVLRTMWLICSVLSFY